MEAASWLDKRVFFFYSPGISTGHFTMFCKEGRLTLHAILKLYNFKFGVIVEQYLRTVVEFLILIQLDIFTSVRLNICKVY